jgi:TPR repeat protein
MKTSWVIVWWLLVCLLTVLSGSIGVAAEPATAPFQEVKAQADQGVVTALFKLGEMYLQGKGVEKNSAQGLDLIKEAAEQGLVEAIQRLAVMYLSGEVVSKDYAEAARWFRRGADQKDPVSQERLGRMYEHGQGLERDYREAVRWYRKAAEQGHMGGQYHLGRIYDEGGGVALVGREATDWYRKAAEQHYPPAFLALGNMYYYGRLVETDYAEALKWYRAAVEAGDLAPAFLLGLMYSEGRAVKPDFVEAYAWLDLAASKDKASRVYRVELEAKMTPEQVNQAQRKSQALRQRIGEASAGVAVRRGLDSGGGAREKRSEVGTNGAFVWKRGDFSVEFPGTPREYEVNKADVFGRKQRVQCAELVVGEPEMLLRAECALVDGHDILAYNEVWAIRAKDQTVKELGLVRSTFSCGFSSGLGGMMQVSGFKESERVRLGIKVVKAIGDRSVFTLTTSCFSKDYWSKPMLRFEESMKRVGPE